MGTADSVVRIFRFQFQYLNSFDGDGDLFGSLASSHDAAVIQFFPVSSDFEDNASLFQLPASFSCADILFAAVRLVVKEHCPVGQGNFGQTAVLVINRLVVDTDLACEKSGFALEGNLYFAVCLYTDSIRKSRSGNLQRFAGDCFAGHRDSVRLVDGG